jgi:hypothetical protein
MTSLILQVDHYAPVDRPYRLAVRVHDLAGTDYYGVAYVGPEQVVALLRTGRVHFLYSDTSGLSEEAGRQGRGGRLSLRWDETVGAGKEFALEVVGDDGTVLPIAMLHYETADDVQGTGGAEWDGGEPYLRTDYLAEIRRRKAADLRAEADRIEPGGELAQA